ncbi:hypothetical protein Bhyg_03454, partial [Pseudolycoriella hygida]
ASNVNKTAVSDCRLHLCRPCSCSEHKDLFPTDRPNTSNPEACHSFFVNVLPFYPSTYHYNVIANLLTHDRQYETTFVIFIGFKGFVATKHFHCEGTFFVNVVVDNAVV